MPPFPKDMPSTVGQCLARHRSLENQRNQPGNFDRDVYDYSGRHSHNWLPTATAPVPVVTTVLPPSVREDDSHEGYESFTSAVTGVSAMAPQIAAVSAPLIGLASLAAMRAGSALSNKGGETSESSEAAK